MRKIILFVFVLTIQLVNAQVPQGLNYQAVVRDASGALLLNQPVTFAMNIVKGEPTASPVYTEWHSVQTDDLGQVSFVIGQGAPMLSTFNQVNWAVGNTYLKIELNTGSGFVNMGTTQFMSVPYAMFSGNAANQMPSGQNLGDMLYYNGVEWTTIPAGVNGQTLTFCDGKPSWGACGASRLAVPGNHQGWNPSTAAHVAAIGASSDCEGYMWLDGGFEFVAKDVNGNFAWGQDSDDYGDDGTFSGKLAGIGESSCEATAGYYLVKANTQALTYSTTPMQWGIIGPATSNGWDTSTPLTYNPANGKWEGIFDLFSGQLRFRANNSWELNLGWGTNDNPYLVYNGNSVELTGGTYFISLDLSQPREYIAQIIPQ